jgi:hypothetical protein
VEGADWSESGVGTNAISEALVTGAPAQLFSAEHLVRTHHDWACTAAPIRDPFTGEVVGVLDVSGPFESVTPDSLRMVRCGVRLAEELLKSAGAPRRTDALRSTLTLRRAEILALLASRTQGWSADELAYRLHGEDGAATAIRTEMHRIRGVLGNVVEPNPYRFSSAVRVVTDVAVVADHLRGGRVADALAAYPAKLLNRSANLSVELMRDELNEAMGASVRSSGDAQLIMRWCASDMGASDVEAAAAMASLIGPGDPRFQLVRARMERVDRELQS